MKKVTLYIVLLIHLLLASCEGVDCPLNNTVYCYYGFYDSTTGKSISLSDTVTVTAEGTDSVLYNRGVNTHSLSLPMSYWNNTDTLNFRIYGKDYSYVSRLYIGKENIQHYESPDCPTTMFHQVSSISFESNVIDSAIIVKSTVNYQQDENIKIYLHTAD